jgi:hypothetical protein
MSDRRDVVGVGAGLPYAVVLVNDRVPASLDDFIVDGVVTVEAASRDQVVTFHGSGRREADFVLVYEKDRGGVGKDVRVWRITSRDGGFDAVERPVH